MQEAVGLKEKSKAAKHYISTMNLRYSKHLSCEQRVDKKLLTTVEDDCFYWDES